MSLTLKAVGDIALVTKDNKNPFRKVSQVLKNKDILFGNLETVLTKDGKVAKKSVVLKSLPEKANYLEEANFDILNIANNHIMDFGLEGLTSTLQILDEKGIDSIGIKHPISPADWTITKKTRDKNWVSW